MPVDNCPHSFAAFASTVMPQYMAELRQAMTRPHKAAEFSKLGIGPVTIANSIGLVSDFSGCYVLLDRSKPMYVGISRSVLSRLRQHVTGKSHFNASLVYAIAQSRLPTKGHRSKVMEKVEFQAAFSAAQDYLRGLDVAFIEIQNPLELHVFEAYAAMELDTCAWNTFRTH